MNTNREFKRGAITVSNHCNGKLQVAVEFENETIWLTESEIARLLGVHIQNVSSSIRAIFKCGEIQKCNVELYRNGVYFYNFDLLVALIFRVKGGYTPLFRGWITQQLVGRTSKRTLHTVFIQSHHQTTQN